MTTTSERSNRLDGLDLLRFGAAMAVVLYHFLYAGPAGGYYWGLPTVAMTSLGWLGVDVFFVISGLVIAISTEGRTATKFAKARFLRLYPAFFFCSLLGTLAWLPSSAPVTEQLVRWAAGLTLFPGLFGYEPHLSVYWTLAVECTFYFWVALLMTTGLWGRHLTAVMFVWLAISLANDFCLESDLLTQVLITRFAGHFCAGIVLYQFYRRTWSQWTPLILAMSWLCFYRYDSGYLSYMEGAFRFQPERGYVVLIPLIIVAIVYALANTPVGLPKKLCSIIGLSSYPLYLTHADIAFWSRSTLDRVVFPSIPWLPKIITPAVHISLSIVVSLVASVLIALHVEPKVRAMFEWLLRRAGRCAVTRPFYKNRSHD